MFAQLIESRPVRRRAPAGIAASMTLHGIIIAGAVILGSRATPRSAPEPPTVIIEFRTPVPDPPKAPPALRPAAPSLPVGRSVISVPLDVPDFIPPIDPLRTIINTDQPVEFRIGGPTRAAGPEPAPLAVEGALFVGEVEFPAALDKRSTMPRYPQVLRDAGIEGMARLSFVVDTLGRVELETVRVMESTHAAFALAIQATLPRMRFVPARIGRRAVRQLVEFPIQFTLKR